MRKRGLTWTCEGHVSCLYQDPELIPMMIESGLIAIQLGIESGSQRVLDAYHKTITAEMSLEVVRQCKEAGIMSVEGNYIIGGARESWETLQESLSHAKKLLKVGRGTEHDLLGTLSRNADCKGTGTIRLKTVPGTHGTCTGFHAGRCPGDGSVVY